MTLFKDLPDESKDGFKLLLTSGVDRVVKDHAEYSAQAYRLMFLSNTAGIALLASFIGVMVGKGQGVGSLLWPLALFLIGTVLSGSFLIRLAAFLEGATTHHANQAFSILVNHMHIERITPWVWSPRSMTLNKASMLGSFGCFVSAVIWLMFFLGTI